MGSTASPPLRFWACQLRPPFYLPCIVTIIREVRSAQHAPFPLGNITFNRVARPASTVERRSPLGSTASPPLRFWACQLRPPFYLLCIATIIREVWSVQHAHFPLGKVTFNRVARPASMVEGRSPVGSTASPPLRFWACQLRPPFYFPCIATIIREVWSVQDAPFPPGNITFKRVARLASTVVVGALARGEHSFSSPALLGVSASLAILPPLHSDNNTGGVECATCSLST